MRNLRPLLVIGLALLIGAVAVYIALRWIGQKSELATIRVVVASRDLAFGTPLHPEMLEIIDWPAKGSLKGPIADPTLLYGRVINTSVMQGEPVVMTKLAASGEKAGLSAMLHDGSRAVTVRVNEIVGVAGFALPGNYVDVMVHAIDKNNHPVSKIVLERILVLALAQDASTIETKPRVVNSVTLEVTPQQAEQIDFARSVGALSLVLRSQVDQSRTISQGARMVDLFPMPTIDARPSMPIPLSAKSNATPNHAKKTAKTPSYEPTPDKPEVIRGVKRTLE